MYRHMFDSGLVDPEASVSGWFERPLARAWAEFLALLLVVVPHANNNDTRKYATLLFIATWGFIRVLVVWQGAPGGLTPSTMPYFDALVALIVGRMWGVEIAGMQEFALSGSAHNNDSTEDDSTDSEQTDKEGSQ